MASTLFNAEALSEFTGEKGTPIYVSVKGVVYNVTAGADFYGPGKSYGVFAGKEVSRCLGKMEVSDNEANAGWRNLSPEHMKTLDDWAAKYDEKYPKMGTFDPDAHFEARGAMLQP